MGNSTIIMTCADYAAMIDGHQSKIATLEAENAKLRAELEFLRLNQRAFVGTLLNSYPLLNDDGLDEIEHHCEWHIQQERKRLHTIIDAARITMLTAAAPSAPKADDPVKVQLLEALESTLAQCLTWQGEPNEEFSCQIHVAVVRQARAAIAAARKGEGK